MESGTNYLLWLIIILLVSFGFDFYKKKEYSKSKIFLLVILQTWIFIGLINSFFTNSFMNFEAIIGAIVEVLPMTIIFGGGTFVYKYYKSKKKI